MMTIKTLSQQFPKPGMLIWIGIRPARKQALFTPDNIMADNTQGLIGDRYSGRSGKRQVTLFQQEHIQAIESFTGTSISPETFRRNLVIQGINLLSLKDQTFQIGAATLQMTGLCHPCSQMEKALGVGGYNAMRGHGGITARVVSGGLMSIGDQVKIIVETATDN
ncbi:MAG: MOSC domain-containing protein [Methylococcales bacterium]